MDTKVTAGLIMLLCKLLVCDDGSERKCPVKPEKMCGTSESDVKLQFQAELTCNHDDNWRLEKHSTDVYFCRNGYLNFPHESGRKNIIFNETSGSVMLSKVQQSDAGLYKLCGDSHTCVCVELVVKTDEEGCNKSLGGDFSGQNDQDDLASSDSTKATNHSTINTQNIIGSVVGAVLLLSVCVSCIIKKKCKATPAQQRNGDVEMNATQQRQENQGQDQDTTNPLMGTDMLPPD